MIRKAPLFFIIVFLVGLAAGYFISNERFEDQITFLSEEVNGYQNGFHGASPVEAARRLDALTTALAETQKQLRRIMGPDIPRHLLPKQKELLSENLKAIAKSVPSVWVVYVTDARGEAFSLAQEFADVMRSSGISPGGPVPGFTTSDKEQGIMIGLIDPDHPSPQAVAFINALKKSEIQISLTKERANPPPIFGFDLFIGPVSQL